MRSAHVLMGLMEVEGGWKWKVDGSGSMEIVVDGPNEPPYSSHPFLNLPSPAPGLSIKCGAIAAIGS